MNVFKLGSYVYGTYLNFTMGSGGGGGSTDPSAQTGDYLMSIIFIVAALIFLAASAVLIFAMFKKIKTAHAVSNAGSIAKSASSKKIIALVVAALIVAAAGASLATKAFAEANYENPSSPPYVTATGTMDKSTNTITVPTVTITDEAVKNTGKYAVIESFSIKGLDQFANQNLGNWTVKIDDFLVYSGKVNVLKESPFILKESGVCRIDISATDVPSDVMDALNGNLGVLVEFGNGKDGNIDVVDRETQPIVSVDLVNWNSVLGSQEFNVAPGREDEFKKLVEDNGWINDRDKVYMKKFDYYTDYKEILSMWNDAIADGLLVNDNPFYKWRIARNSFTNILLADETFTPEWLPSVKPVKFQYILGYDVELTSYGQNVLMEKGWVLKQQPSVGGDEEPKYIEGTVTNLTDISEINDVLTAECFIYAYDVFNGWQYTDGKIFENNGNYDEFYNNANVSAITVLLGGMVVDEAGKGMPNVCVAFKPLGGARESKLKSRGRTAKPLFPTVTDANGNYRIPVDKGLTGVMYFGITLFDNLDNNWVGQSLLLENVKAQDIPTIVVRTKVLLHFEKQTDPGDSNKQILDYGATKFVNTKGEVFYQTTSDIDGIIEVYGHDSGKLIYESAMYYGEVDIADTSTAANPVTLQIKQKDPEKDSDCMIKGIAYLYVSIDNKVPLKNAELIFTLRDTTTQDWETISVKTNENGEYSFKGFQGVYIEQVDCKSSEGEEYSTRYDVLMTYGEIFLHDVNFADFTEAVKEIV